MPNEAYREDKRALSDEWETENLAILCQLSLNLARLHLKKQSMEEKLTQPVDLINSETNCCL